MKHYTGVGARSTPSNLSEYIKTLASKLDDLGYVLRSGGADGADKFFESGATHKEIYLPWKFFNKLSGSGYYVFTELSKEIQNEAGDIASKIHPNWNALSSGAKLLHSRNVLQVCGLDLKTPSKFLICWTKNGEATGGTRTAIVLALAHNIPVFNLAKEEDKVRIDKWLGPDFS